MPLRIQTWNRYAYVTNNPVSFTDPTGLVRTPWGIFGGNVSALGTANEFDLMNIPVVIAGSWYWNDGWHQVDAGNGSDLFGGTGEVGGGTPDSPNDGTQQPQTTACTSTILSAVNNRFGTNATPDNVQGDPFPNGQATNLNIQLTGLPAGQFNSIQTGRYPVNWWTYLTGYGPTLHVTGQNSFDPTASFQNSNIGGLTSVTFTAHIDYGFPFNPFGALFHLFREVFHIGGPRKPC